MRKAQGPVVSTGAGQWWFQRGVVLVAVALALGVLTGPLLTPAHAVVSTWQTVTPNGTTFDSPAITVHHNDTFVAIRGEDDGIWWSLNHGSYERFSTGATQAAPTFTEFNGSLYLFHTGTDGHAWYSVLAETGESGSWGAWTAVPGSNSLPGGGTIKINTRIAATATSRYLYLTMTGTSQRISVTKLNTNGQWGPSPFEIPGGGRTDSSPAVTSTSAGHLFFTHRGTDDNIYLQQYSEPSSEFVSGGWVQDAALGHTSSGPAATTYSTADGARVMIAVRGKDNRAWYSSFAESAPESPTSWAPVPEDSVSSSHGGALTTLPVNVTATPHDGVVMVLTVQNTSSAGAWARHPIIKTVPGTVQDSQPTNPLIAAAWAPSMTAGGPTFTNQTIRMIAHSSIAGDALRIHLSNLRSTTPLTVGAVNVATQANSATGVAGSQHSVTFSGNTSLVIDAGQEVTSDPVPMSVQADHNTLVSLYLPNATGSATWHSDAFDTSYLSTPGDHSSDIDGSNYPRTTTSWYYLSGLDVIPTTARGSVVTFGDSITDGYNTPTSANHRWPDDLARRLDQTRPMGVVDAGIGGNRVLTDVPNISQGVSAVKRFAHDALNQADVRDVILLEGINDIGNNAGPGSGPLTVQDLITGYQNLIQQSHSSGVRIIGGTLPPDKGNVYYSPSAETLRQAVNSWIRTSGAFDGIVDFDKAVANPANPTELKPAFDSGDHLHPNEAGMQALANAVDLTLLT